MTHVNIYWVASVAHCKLLLADLSQYRNLVAALCWLCEVSIFTVEIEIVSHGRCKSCQARMAAAGSGSNQAEELQRLHPDWNFLRNPLDTTFDLTWPGVELGVPLASAPQTPDGLTTFWGSVPAGTTPDEAAALYRARKSEWIANERRALAPQLVESEPQPPPPPPPPRVVQPQLTPHLHAAFPVPAPAPVTTPKSAPPAAPSFQSEYPSAAAAPDKTGANTTRAQIPRPSSMPELASKAQPQMTTPTMPTNTPAVPPEQLPQLPQRLIPAHSSSNDDEDVTGRCLGQVLTSLIEGGFSTL